MAKSLERSALSVWKGLRSRKQGVRIIGPGGKKHGLVDPRSYVIGPLFILRLLAHMAGIHFPTSYSSILPSSVPFEMQVIHMTVHSSEIEICTMLSWVDQDRKR